MKPPRGKTATPAAKATPDTPRHRRGAEARTERRPRLPDRHAVVERNLERYPWSRLSDDHGDQAQLQLLLDQAGADGAAWTVTPPAGDRVPGPFDADVYIALATIYNTVIPREERAVKRRFETDLGEMAEVMGRERGGTTYEAMRGSLRRLRRTEVRAVRTFREGDTVAEERTFSIIGELTFRYRRDGDRAKTGVIVEFPQTIADSIARGHFRLLNVGLYFALETPTARKLYRYLDVKRWRGNEARSVLTLGLRELAEELPIDRDAPAHIKRTLSPAHEQLIAAGYLASAEYEEHAVPGKRRPLWMVRYVFGERADAPRLRPGAPAPATDGGGARPRAEARVGTPLSDLVAEILGELRDDRSRAFYTRCAKLVPEEMLRGVLGAVRQMRHEGESIELRRKTFTATIKARAAAAGIAL